MNLTPRGIVVVELLGAVLMSATIVYFVEVLGESRGLYAFLGLAWVAAIWVSYVLLKVDRENRERARAEERGF